MPVKDVLGELVSIESVFPGEARLAEHLSGRLRELGFSVHKAYVDGGRFNILAERECSGDPSLLFYGHMDTVPRYGSWKTDPLRLTESGGRLYGLGACDMKGGIAALLEALGRSGNDAVKVLLCIDEENISKGVWSAVKQNRQWFDDVGIIVSAEPGISRSSVGGAGVVTLGRRGRVVITAEVTGVSSHGANPEQGVNAVEEASVMSSNLHRLRLSRHRRLGTENIFTRAMHGASTSLSVPDKAYVEFDFQTVPPCTADRARARVQEYVGSLQASGRLNSGTTVSVAVKARETPYIDPYESRLGSRPVKGMLRMLGRDFGKPRINYGTSVADENVLFNETGKPVITIGPEGGNEHSANEWVSGSSLEDMVGVYSAMISGHRWS